MNPQGRQINLGVILVIIIFNYFILNCWVNKIKSLICNTKHLCSNVQLSVVIYCDFYKTLFEFLDFRAAVINQLIDD